jgi:serine/threonine-protein kinase
MLRGRSGRQDTLITERAAAPYGAASAAVATAAAPTRMPAAPPVTPPAASPPARNPARRRKVRRTLLAVLLVLLLGAAAVYGGWWFAAGRYSRVPNVAGDPVASARAELTHAHFHVGSVSQQFSETIAAGRVIGADPAAGSRLVRGGTVTLVISRGKERFTVPSVAGRTESAARAALAAIPIQISPDATPQSSDTVKKGRVIGTSPPAGRLVRRGQSVTLIVSDGPPVLPIPSIAPNTTFDEASAALSHAGFRVVRKDQYSSDVPAGIVISSDPTGSAAKGTRINVVVSKGPQLVAVPQIPAQASLGQAEAALSQAGLSPVVRSFGDTSPDAAVLAISPKPGTQVQIGSAVTIYAI